MSDLDSFEKVGFQRFPGLQQEETPDELSMNIEDIRRIGYTTIPNVFDEAWLKQAREKIDQIWEKQLTEYGGEFLQSIGDFGQVRAMMSEDNFFLDLITHPVIDEVINRTVGPTAILHLQNGIVVYPERRHNQAKYHRDFAKDFVASKMLSVNIFVVVDPLNQETGGTWVIPASHLKDDLPSSYYVNKHRVQICAEPGSIVAFDSLIWHRGGTNFSSNIRRAINHQFTRPFIKQQLDYPSFLKGKVDPESKLAQRLGMWTVPPKSVKEYRVADPKLRTYRGGQG